MKAELELVFENLPYEDSVKIKNILIGGKQFKLQKRFKDFITSNIGDEYFMKQVSAQFVVVFLIEL